MNNFSSVYQIVYKMNTTPTPLAAKTVDSIETISEEKGYFKSTYIQADGAKVNFITYNKGKMCPKVISMIIINDDDSVEKTERSKMITRSYKAEENMMEEKKKLIKKTILNQFSSPEDEAQLKFKSVMQDKGMLDEKNVLVDIFEQILIINEIISECIAMGETLIEANILKPDNIKDIKSTKDVHAKMIEEVTLKDAKAVSHLLNSLIDMAKNLEKCILESDILNVSELLSNSSETPNDIIDSKR